MLEQQKKKKKWRQRRGGSIKTAIERSGVLFDSGVSRSWPAWTCCTVERIKRWKAEERVTHVDPLNRNTTQWSLSTLLSFHWWHGDVGAILQRLVAVGLRRLIRFVADWSVGRIVFRRLPEHTGSEFTMLEMVKVLTITAVLFHCTSKPSLTPPRSSTKYI